ncbi:hypothetical protein H0H93_008189, partial [Arthromyces matolae]
KLATAANELVASAPKVSIAGRIPETQIDSSSDLIPLANAIKNTHSGSHCFCTTRVHYIDSISRTWAEGYINLKELNVAICVEGSGAYPDAMNEQAH